MSAANVQDRIEADAEAAYALGDHLHPWDDASEATREQYRNVVTRNNADHLLDLLDRAGREPIAFDGVSGALVECWVEGGEYRRCFPGNTITEAARSALGLNPESGDRGFTDE